MPEEGIFFVDEHHKNNYILLLIHFNVREDREYSTACYVLAHPEIYRKVNWNGCERPFDFMKWRGNNRIDLSNGYILLVQMARNLFCSSNNFNLMDGISTWDASLKRIFYQAMDLRLGKVGIYEMV
jgi:hypothetical protein